MLQLLFLTLTIIFFFTSPSYAGAPIGAPEIPAGFSPLILTGIIFSAIAFKGYLKKD